ncbi:hypothetical protein TNIN_291571 [Trichonephila inaurata madagascariensis]|uniref:Uncharacterized protein n=1 Tax=Trichonephila inaurata madagascariensis TaxID=2747483 RepID=A0A8X6I474_9ARAC|nr:hypothetical protein TNIN_291571 [Trichonephila inaurata madagascariensis]
MASFTGWVMVRPLVRAAPKYGFARRNQGLTFPFVLFSRIAANPPKTTRESLHSVIFDGWILVSAQKYRNNLVPIRAAKSSKLGKKTFLIGASLLRLHTKYTFD